jgi:K+-transporting ATPase A subunit
VLAVNKLYGKEAALAAANFLSRADGLETIPDLVRYLRKNAGETVANFTVGYFGAGMTLPGFEDNEYED